MPVTATTEWRSIPPLDPAMFRRVLDALGSPYATEADACCNASGDLSALALAQSVRESRAGTASDPLLNEAKNPLGLTPPDGDSDGAVYVPRVKRWFVGFASWADSYAEYHRRLTDPTYKPGNPGVYQRTTTLRELVETYVGDDGMTDRDAYAAAMAADLNAWGVAPHEETPPVSDPTPTIYDIRISDDADRFGLDSGEVAYLLGRCFPGRSDGSATGAPNYVVLHIQDGVTHGSLDWWIHGPGVEASVTVMAQRDGSLLQVIPEGDGPWTNGDAQGSTAQAGPLLAKPGNPNLWCLTIECEGYSYAPNPFGWEAQQLTAAQLAAVVWQIRDWEARHGVVHDRAHILPHSAINGITRAHCPGAVYEQVWAALGPSPAPTPAPSPSPTPPPQPIPAPADPNGPLSRAWLAAGVKSGHFPAIRAAKEAPDGREFVFMADGSGWWRPDGKAAWRSLATA